MTYTKLANVVVPVEGEKRGGEEGEKGEGRRCGKVEGGRWTMEGGGWRAEGGGRRAEGGGRRVEGGGWRVEGGGWRVEEDKEIIPPNINYTISRNCAGIIFPRKNLNCLLLIWKLNKSRHRRGATKFSTSELAKIVSAPRPNLVVLSEHEGVVTATREIHNLQFFT
jgi:hypothetical protein